MDVKMLKAAGGKKNSVVIGICFFDHIFKFLIEELFTQAVHHLSEFVSGNLSRPILADNLECFNDFGIRIFRFNLASHESQKLGKIDSATSICINFINHITQIVCCRLSKTAHYSSKIGGGDGPVATIVNQLERIDLGTFGFANIFGKKELGVNQGGW